MADRELIDRDDDLRRLATLVVEALEIGTGKGERDIGDDLCRALGVDLREIEERYRHWIRNRKRELRAALSNALADNADSAAHLMSEVARCGGRFLAMVEEIYAFLSAQRKTTTGSSEEFRFRKDGVQLEDLPISPAFIEQIRATEHTLRQIVTGKIDDAKLSRFLGMDGGEFYGTWPILKPREAAGKKARLGLARAITQLAWVGQFVAGHREIHRDWRATEAALSRTVRSGEKLIQVAESLIRAYAWWLRSEGFEAALEELDGFQARQLQNERELLETQAVLGSAVNANYYVGIEEPCLLGIRVDQLTGNPGRPGSRPDPVAVLEAAYQHSGTGPSHLACLVALWRGGFQRTEKHDAQFQEEFSLKSPDEVTLWLSEVEIASHEAVDWLEHEVWAADGTFSRREIVERFEEYLRLPLWRHRDLLYEIWLLCETIRAAETGGWAAELFTLEAEGQVWVLAVGPSDDPVARIVLDAEDPVEAMVWREPRRIVGQRQLTPDIAISTPGPDPRDLVVVEAKDRYRMASGFFVSTWLGGRWKKASPNNARAVGEKYRQALHPTVTWVCNHCDFREEDVDSQTNHGDAWRRLYLGSAVRPGSVPAGFARSILEGLMPTGRSAEPDSASTFLLVLDTTASMHDHLSDVWERLGEPSVVDALDERFDAFRGLLFADHGDGEPYLIREVGPSAEIQELIEAMKGEPLGSGGDAPEALEDAMRRCRTWALELGSLCVLIMTDAPPHPIEACPSSIDFHEEVAGLLETGSSCYVADDWQEESEEATWAPYEDAPRFHRLALKEILPKLTESD